MTHEPKRNQPAFRVALEELGLGALNIVDVGARWGACESWFRLSPLGRLVGFEPDSEECSRLNCHANHACDQFFPYALGKVDGDGLLHVTRQPACSSLFPPSEFMRERFPTLRSDMEQVGECLVPITRLDTWAKTAGVNRIDLIKIDTQGGELDVLLGAGELLNECLAIEAEVMFSPLYIGQPLFSDIDTFLRQHGFTLWRLSNLAHYAESPSEILSNTSMVHFDYSTVNHPIGSGRLVWANAIYFKDRSAVSDRRSILALAALMEAAGELDGSQACLKTLPQHFAPEFSRPTDVEGMIQKFELASGDARRVRITVGCDASDTIPKTSNAGTRYVVDNTSLQIMHNGIRIVEGCYHGRWMTAIIEALGGHHEPQEERAFHEVLKHIGPGSCMIELGSFWAYYSMWFGLSIPRSRTLMVEPDPGNLEVGRRNFAINGIRGEFLQGSIGRCNSAAKPFLCESDNQLHDAPQFSVDELIGQKSMPRVDLLLADIQGAELDMLHGAAASIEQGLLRFVFVSTHHHVISNDPLMHQKCLDFIRAHNGYVLAEHNVAESFSGDGLIVASFDKGDRDLPLIHLSRNCPSNSLFRETEYDLADAYRAISESGKELKELAIQNPQIANELNRIRSQNSLFSKAWPSFF